MLIFKAELGAEGEAALGRYRLGEILAGFVDAGGSGSGRQPHSLAVARQAHKKSCQIHGGIKVFEPRTCFPVIFLSAVCQRSKETRCTNLWAWLAAVLTAGQLAAAGAMAG